MFVIILMTMVLLGAAVSSEAEAVSNQDAYSRIDESFQLNRGTTVWDMCEDLTTSTASLLTCARQVLFENQHKLGVSWQSTEAVNLKEGRRFRYDTRYYLPEQYRVPSITTDSSLAPSQPEQHVAAHTAESQLPVANPADASDQLVSQLQSLLSEREVIIAVSELFESPFIAEKLPLYEINLTNEEGPVADTDLSQLPTINYKEQKNESVSQPNTNLPEEGAGVGDEISDSQPNSEEVHADRGILDDAMATTEEQFGGYETTVVEATRAQTHNEERIRQLTAANQRYAGAIALLLLLLIGFMVHAMYLHLPHKVQLRNGKKIAASRLVEEQQGERRLHEIKEEALRETLKFTTTGEIIYHYGGATYRLPYHSVDFRDPNTTPTCFTSYTQGGQTFIVNVQDAIRWIKEEDERKLQFIISPVT